MEILLYNVKVSVCLIAFYLLYRLFLSKETFVRMNRIVILVAVALSFVLPRCGLTLESASESVVGNMSLSVILDGITVGVESGGVAEGGMVHDWSWREAVALLYWAGVAIFVVRLIVSVFQVIRFLRKGERVSLGEGVTLVLNDSNMSPFSWLRYVSMNRSDYEQKNHEILIHELAHIRYGHSIDLMAMDVACCMQWFNPAMWLMRSELCAVHEFEADKAVLDSGVNAKQYQILLIKKAAGAKWSSVANSFNHGKLKNRITMMLRKESSVWARAKVLYALPIIGGAMIAFANVACSESEVISKEENMQEEISGVVEGVKEENVDIVENMKGKLLEKGILEKNVTIEKNAETGERYMNYVTKSGEKVSFSEKSNSYIWVGMEGMPQFPNGDQALREYLASEVRYPEAAMKAGIEGRVFCHFVVDEEGNVVDVNVARSIDPNLDAEAIRVVSSMPKWKPGNVDGEPVRVSYTVPINFVLN